MVVSVLKRFLKEGGWLLILLAALYLSGWHTEVAGFIQRGLLYTGLFSPDRAAENPEAVSLDALVLYDEEGNTIRGTELKGEVLLVNVWASWCPPCLAEMPGLNKLYEKMEPAGVRFLMVTVDKDFNKAVALRDRKGYKFPIYHVGQLPGELQTQSIPATFVLDKNAMLRVKHLGMARYDTDSFEQLLLQLQKK